MKTRRRNSLRLKGYDYSQPGEYFVTICTADRMCILGGIVDDMMRLSHIGKAVDECWRKTPEQYPNIRVGAFQIMPNHVHGIIQIKENSRRGEVPSPAKDDSPKSKKGDETSPLRKIPLGDVVAYFKYQATKQINQMRGTPGKKVFQRNYHDHILRDDIDHYFVERYIELNPVMWELDSDNPRTREMSIETLKKTLLEDHALNGVVLERVIEYEMNYREGYEERDLGSSSNRSYSMNPSSWLGLNLLRRRSRPKWKSG